MPYTSFSDLSHVLMLTALAALLAAGVVSCTDDSPSEVVSSVGHTPGTVAEAPPVLLDDLWSVDAESPAAHDDSAESSRPGHGPRR